MTTGASRPVAAAGRCAVAEGLEGRWLLASGTAAPGAVPYLHSLPGAPAAVFLDFDGYAPTYAPYDTDGDPATFGPAEQAVIRGAWRGVSSYFSMFDVDVTTEPPDVPFSYSVISNSVASGINTGRFPSTEPTNFNTPSEAQFRPAALAHEIGHGFGLDHQSEFDSRGVKVREYTLGYDDLHGAIMGSDTARHVPKWFVGHPAFSPAAVQADVDVIAAAVARYAGGDGFRADDHPDDLAAAQPLAPNENQTFSASGVIEQMSDADAFSFTARGGEVRIDLVPPAPSTLDAKVEVYGPDGTLLAGADGPLSDEHLDLPSLPQGTFSVVVKSHGGYGDLGPYDLTVRVGDVPRPEEPHGALPAPASVTASRGADTAIDVRWDAVAGATGYAIDRSDDGAAWAEVARVGGETTAYSTPQLPGARCYFFRVAALGADGRSAPSAAVSLVNRPSPPVAVSYSTWGSTTMILNWRDTAGETGYRVERLTYAPNVAASAWAVIGQTAANVPSFADSDVKQDARYRYRVTATGADGDSQPVEISANMPLLQVPNFWLANRQAGRVDLAWGRIDYAIQYEVQRSDDGGAHFDTVAFLVGTTWSDTKVEPLHRYLYRVVCTNDLFERAPSATVSVVAPLGAPLPAGWQVTETGFARPPGFASTDYAGYSATDESFHVVGGGAGFLKPDGTGLLRGEAFRLVYRGLATDGSLTARVREAGQGFAGVMVSDYYSGGRMFAFVGVSSQFGPVAVTRTEFNTLSDVTPLAASNGNWFRVVRGPRTVSVQTVGADNLWHTAASIPWDNPSAYVGLVVSSDSAAGLSSATFGDVKLASAQADPIILAVPAASPPVVDGTRATLSVLAGSTSGEYLFSYRWSVLQKPAGAASPTFDRNSSDAAKTVTATFRATGHYVFQVLINDALGRYTYATLAVDVVPAVGAVAVSSPAVAPIHAGEALPFRATFRDQFGAPYPATAPAPDVRWSASAGNVSADGRYAAGDAPGWATVTAAVGTVSGSASVYVYNDTAPALVSAVSRKRHGAAGPVDLPLALYGAPPTIEPRLGGAATLRFTFSTDVVAGDGALDATDFAITNAAFRSARIDGNVVTLDLAGVADGTLVTVALTGITGTHGAALGGDSDVQVRSLYGDADRDGSVTARDLLALRSRQPRRPSTADLLYDLDLSGSVSAADVAACLRRIGR